MLDTQHFIAVRTYGKRMHGGQSDLKLASGSALPVLQALFKDKARRFSTPRASYQYLNIDPEIELPLHHHYLLLKVDDSEKMLVESICRRANGYNWVYLWDAQKQRWLEFPNQQHAEYRADQSSKPDFKPVEARFVTPVRSALIEPPLIPPTAVGSEILFQPRRFSTPERAIATETAPPENAKSIITATPLINKPELSTDNPVLSNGPITETIINSTNQQFLITKQLVPLNTFATSEVHTSIPFTSEPAVTTESAVLNDEPVNDEPVSETIMRSVRSDDVTTALIAYIHDNDMDIPILIDFMGARNAVKQLLVKPFNPAYIGARADGSAFIITNGDQRKGFQLPDLNYKAFSSSLNSRVVEGRIVALTATVAAGRDLCYVLVRHHIELPSDCMDDWLHYLRYQQTPQHPEFKQYTAPLWASDLYNIYQALRSRIGCPLHERWMPWLFRKIDGQRFSSQKADLHSIALCQYIKGYVDERATGNIECGAYRLYGQNMKALWVELLISNPDRADGIVFNNALQTTDS